MQDLQRGPRVWMASSAARRSQWQLEAGRVFITWVRRGLGQRARSQVTRVGRVGHVASELNVRRCHPVKRAARSRPDTSVQIVLVRRRVLQRVDYQA